MPELVGKLPGYVPPSTACMSADIPYGLAVTSTERLLSDCRVGHGKGKGKSYITTGCITPEIRPELAGKLSSHLSPTMALKSIGPFFQAGSTGSAWGEWALSTGPPLRAVESKSVNASYDAEHPALHPGGDGLGNREWAPRQGCAAPVGTGPLARRPGTVEVCRAA